jgi:hypothetical protein
VRSVRPDGDRVELRFGQPAPLVPSLSRDCLSFLSLGTRTVLRQARDERYVERCL